MAAKRFPVIRDGITYWRCSKCKELKTADHFHKNKSTPNGLRYYCKPCAMISVTGWQDKNPEWVKTYDAGYRKTKNGKVTRKKAQERSRARYPEQARARELAYNARSRGDLIPQPCEVCGTIEDIHAHHDDYFKPLEVRWLCRTHHNEHHRNLKIGEPHEQYVLMDISLY